MTIYLVPLGVAAAFLLAAWAFCRLTRDPPESRVHRLADPAPMPGELDPFPVDLATVHTRSDATAATESFEREIERITRWGERRWGKA